VDTSSCGRAGDSNKATARIRVIAIVCIVLIDGEGEGGPGRGTGTLMPDQIKRRESPVHRCHRHIIKGDSERAKPIWERIFFRFD